MRVLITQNIQKVSIIFIHLDKQNCPSILEEKNCVCVCVWREKERALSPVNILNNEILLMCLKYKEDYSYIGYPRLTQKFYHPLLWTIR